MRQGTMEEIPEKHRELYREIRAIADRKEVLPEDNKQQEMDENPDQSFMGRPEFYGSSSRLSPLRDTDAIDALREESRRHRSMSYSEPSWNTHVHSHIFRLARQAMVPQQDVVATRWENVTHLAIPLHLQPESSSGAKEARKIDFAITIDDKPLALALKARLLRATPGEYPATNHSPLGVLVETKSGPAESLIQLGVWAHAIFKHCRDALGDFPPFLPLLSVIGEKWSLLLAVQDEDGTTTIYEELSIGNSSDKVGILQILSTLAFLYEWVGSDYYQWWAERLGLSKQGEGS
ncbi:MAG: hypothetical protein Q9164_006833 [Protoblastenia rupestris]